MEQILHMDELRSQPIEDLKFRWRVGAKKIKAEKESNERSSKQLILLYWFWYWISFREFQRSKTANKEHYKEL